MVSGALKPGWADERLHALLHDGHVCFEPGEVADYPLDVTVGDEEITLRWEGREKSVRPVGGFAVGHLEVRAYLGSLEVTVSFSSHHAVSRSSVRWYADER